jgi:hypothetical protein
MLLHPGYWPDTYWPDRYWMVDSWPEFGLETTPPPASTGSGLPRPMRRPKVQEDIEVEELLLLF